MPLPLSYSSEPWKKTGQGWFFSFDGWKKPESQRDQGTCLKWHSCKVAKPELESGIVPSSPTCFPPLYIAFLCVTKKGIVRPKAGRGGLVFAWWLTASKALFPILSSFWGRHLSISLSPAPRQHSLIGSQKEQAREADFMVVYSGMKSFQVWTPSGNLRFAALCL